MSHEPVTGERMDDAWLLEQWERNLAVIGMRDGPDAPAANILRGFANRVLQYASDPATLHAALSIAFIERERAKDASGVDSPSRTSHDGS